MHTTAEMEFPEEVLAARWLGEPRVTFLMRAGAAGIVLLDDSRDDFERERGLL